MRHSISFITGTSPVSRPAATDDLPGGGHHVLDPLGVDPAGHQIYLLEHFDDESGDLPQLHCIHTRGPSFGRMVPVRSWYQGDPRKVEAEFEPRLAALCARLRPLEPTARRGFELSTRVVRRRALRLYPAAAPIRKFLLRLTVRPTEGEATASIGARTEVTAYLRPRAHLAEVLDVPGEDLALAIVSYVGVPLELGYDKNVGLLVPVAG